MPDQNEPLFRGLGATPEELDQAARWVLNVNVDPRRNETIAWVKQHVAENSNR